jgi:HPt (histidine-containing phosphotransfer) domain-containing protein
MPIFLKIKMSNRFEYVNLGYLEEISGGDTGFQKELIEIFLKQVPDFVSNMNRFLTNNEISELAKEAHTAKSSVLIFMMDETGKTLKQIQNLAESNKTDEIPPLLTEVGNSLEGATKELSGYLTEL